MNHPRTVREVIVDFRGRRAGIIKALTNDVEEFYRLCDPNNPFLCLYGSPNHQWHINSPPRSELPEPRLGISLDRDDMSRDEWLSRVAWQSDAWLYTVASYFAARFKFDKADRKRLFNKITDVPSIWEVMTAAARKRTIREESGGLPEEMILEVLARLPVKDLLTYRLVCKNWLALIDDPDFVFTHLNNYKNNFEGSHLLVMERPKNWLRNGHVVVRRSDTFRKVVELDYFLEGHGSNSCHLSYINGVMLVRRGNLHALLEIMLWNPSINRSLNVPNTVFQDMRDATYFELGFGFDASCDDYKVIAIVYPDAEIDHTSGNKRYRATVPGLVQVYTLCTNSWNSNVGVESVDPPPCWSVGPQVFVNGAIHWTNMGPKIKDDLWYEMEDSHIIAFDVSNEVFNYMELPREINRGHDHEPITEKTPVILDGSLAMFYAYHTYNDIWVMEEYGVPNSWIQRYKFTLLFDNFLYLKSNGELLFALEGKGVKSYDLHRKQVRDLAKTYCKSSKYSVFTYVESLVLFKV